MDSSIHLLLVFSALIGGLLAWKSPKWMLEHHTSLQVFSGAFLFALTVSHLIPELFAMVFGEHHYHESNADLHTVGLFILLGYFMESIIESFSKGVEHGHLHDNSHNSKSSLLLTVSLCLHGLIDGTVLFNPHEHHHEGEHGTTMLIGILIHKLPVSFVLMYQLIKNETKKNKIWSFFILFVISSPVGYFLGEYVFGASGSFYTFAVYAFALITGNFLNISTTIFVESNKGHKLFPKNRLPILLGIGIAVLMQLME